MLVLILAPCFKSKFITAELAHLFSQSDSEEFEGFSEDEEDQLSFNKQKKVVDSEGSDVDTSFYSDGEEASQQKRRSLLVALRFPIKRASSTKPELQEEKCKTAVKGDAPSQRRRGRRARNEQQYKEEEEEAEKDKTDVLSQSLNKRNKNIQENKAMVSKSETFCSCFLCIRCIFKLFLSYFLLLLTN
ncbi:cell division cycle-associated 7-like protein [Oryzias melastigma]|uniref:cell division cycle-associated 7-like protein n=1 Tax=Oryzias melastigma TaxID=30732 RepID=UPI00168D445B|nr:cell division cycle-associated 7-like protein [Oryzias melastigma]